MKEKINLLSKGIFEYEKPDVVVSEEKLNIEVEMGSIYSGAFEINSINHVEIRALFYSSNKLMHCTPDTMIGTSKSISYTFDATNLELGEVVNGHISVVSNGGELEIPFRVQVCAPFCRTSIGQLNDLYQFAQLAKDNWYEALKIFKSRDFERVFLLNKKNIHTYESLIKSRSVNQGMEEFLCTLRLKKSIHLTVAQDELEFRNVRDSFSEKLVLEKDQWGYLDIRIRTEGDFIRIYKKTLTTEEFYGSYFQLDYMIEPKACAQSVNYGRIILETFYTTIEIPVVCTLEGHREVELKRRSLKKNLCQLTKDYMDYMGGGMPKAKWIAATRDHIDGCLNQSKDVRYRLLEAHFCVLAGEQRNAGLILDSINGRELRRKSVIYYCYHLYISALYREDSGYTRFALDQMKYHYEGTHDYWEILWMMGQLSPSYIADDASYLRKIKTYMAKGFHTPFLYLEAVTVLNRTPALIRELGVYEVRLLVWGSRRKLLSREAILQMAQVAAKTKIYDEAALKALMAQWDQIQDRGLLTAICHLMILGRCTGGECNYWYTRAIEAAVRENELYEYYMESLDTRTTEQLPHAVLLYFSYNNRLEDDKKAFLYSYVVRHREEFPEIYGNYENIMKAFVQEQLKNQYIDESMAVLYKQYITRDNMTSKVAASLPGIMFKHRLSCDQPYLTEVRVSHREVTQEERYPIVDGIAYVDIYMDDYKITFLDKDNNRFMGTVEYQLERLMDISYYIKDCYELNSDNAMILLNRSERAIKYQQVDDTSINIYKQTLTLSNIRSQYQKNILKNLIDFYYDNYEGETLEKYLQRINIHMLGNDERGSIIEYFIQRGLFEQAYEAVKVYGYEDIQDKRLMRLCSRIIRTNGFEEEPMLIEIAFQTFSGGKYDEAILQYLIKYYKGTTKDMYAIWKAASDFEVEAHDLEDRLLCQTLFTESTSAGTVEVFESYYGYHPNERIVHGFLAYEAYLYLVKEKNVTESLFKYMEIEMTQMDKAKDVCALAVLKHYSILGVQNRWAKAGEVMTGELHRFISKGIILPFFVAFADDVALPKELLDRTYIEYHTNPHHRVLLNYTIGERGREVQEEMVNVFNGIFVKAIQLFGDETIRYYITEETQLAQTIGDLHEQKGNGTQGDALETGADYINRMIEQRAFNDDEALLQTIREFEEKKYTAEQLFETLE